MKLYRNYKYKLYPNKLQKDLLNLHFFLSNQAWNSTLSMKMGDLSKNSNLPVADKVYIKDKDIEKAMNNEIKARGFKPHSGIVQESFKSMKKSLKNFYDKRKSNPSNTVGFPKFKTSNEIEQSFYFKNQGVSWTDSHFSILRNKIKWDFHRDLPENHKLTGLVVKKESDGNYYIILNISFDNSTEYQKSGLECGIDLNIKNIAITDSEGNSKRIFLPDFSKSKYSKTFIKLQKQLSKRYKEKNFSKNTKKMQMKSNKMYKKIKNKKEDFFHKLSNELTNKFDRITFEALEIKKMKESKSARLNRLISDVSWNSLIEKTKYKSEMKNKNVREINPAYSSQRCNKCGFIHKDNRKSQSDFNCLKCNNTVNADENASSNILDYDIWSLEQKSMIDRWFTD